MKTTAGTAPVANIQRQLAGAGADQDPVDEIGQEDAGDDGQLVDRDEGAADRGGAISEM